MLGLHALSVSPETILILEFSLVLGALFAIFGDSSESRKFRPFIGIVAIVSALSLGRVLFGPIPNIQPVTIGVLLVGATYGARKGIGIGILIAIVSNISLGSGMWTPFQAIGWGTIALGGSLAANQLIINEKLSLRNLIIAGFISAFVFDFIVSMSILVGDPNLGLFLSYLITGLPFDLLHAAGNFVIAVTLGPSMYNILLRSLSPTNLKIRSVANESRVE